MRNFIIAAVFFQVITAQTFQDANILEGHLDIVVEDNLVGGGQALAAEDPDSENWMERSIISVRSIKLNQVEVTHTRPWTKALLAQLKNIVKQNGFYKMRLYQKNVKNPSYVYTFTDACLLYQGGLSETLTILVDSTSDLGGISNTIIGASIASPYMNHCAPDLTDAMRAELDKHTLQGFNSTLTLRTPVPAIMPDTATFIERMDAMKKEKMENKDNRSFFAKYWMYIVPFVLLLVISNGGQEGGR